MDEIKGKLVSKQDRDGYHPEAYNKHITKEMLDFYTEELCSLLQKIDVSTLSLEAQIWWRDHQIADKERLLDNIKKRKKRMQIEEILARLTDYEKKLLGLDL